MSYLCDVQCIVDMVSPRVVMERDRERMCASTCMHIIRFVLRMEECTCDILPNYVKSDLYGGTVDL